MSTSPRSRQTTGISNGNFVESTYARDSDCVDGPGDDLDRNGKTTESDQAEFRTPICQAAVQTGIDPARASPVDTAILYGVIPLFSTGNGQNPAVAIARPCFALEKRGLWESRGGSRVGKRKRTWVPETAGRATRSGASHRNYSGEIRG